MTTPTLQSALPASSQEATAAAIRKDFQSTLKLPKGVDRYLVARAVDRMLQKTKQLDGTVRGMSIEEVKSKMGLVTREAEYVTQVVAEFVLWEMANNKPEPEPTTKDTALSGLPILGTATGVRNDPSQKKE